jgi:hypothetical protein
MGPYTVENVTFYLISKYVLPPFCLPMSSANDHSSLQRRRVMIPFSSRLSTCSPVVPRALDDALPSDGVLGLGSAPGSFFQGLVDQGLDRMSPLLPLPALSTPTRTLVFTSTSHCLALFGIYYSPHGLNGTSEITMGGIDFSKFSTPLNYASVISDADGGWTIASTGGSVNGQTPDLLKDSLNIFFDSGTPNVVLPQKMAEVRKSRFHYQKMAILLYSGHLRCHIPRYKTQPINTRFLRPALFPNDQHFCRTHIWLQLQFGRDLRHNHSNKRIQPRSLQQQSFPVPGVD